MPEKHKLSDVSLDEVSLVDTPANRLAKVVLMKRADPACKKTGTCEEVEKAPAGIQFNIGFKEAGGSEIQSVVFDSTKWTADDAKKWLKDHEMAIGEMFEDKSTLRFRQRDPAEFKRFRMIRPGAQVSKALRAKDSWQRLQNQVDAAVRAKFQPKVEAGMVAAGYLYIRDLYEDSVVLDQDGNTYRVDYEISYDDNGEAHVDVGERVPVEIVYQDVKKTDQEPEIPAELLFRLGKLQAQVTEVARRVEKFNPNHAADGKFSSGSGGGGGGSTSSDAQYRTFARETSINARKKSDRANKSTAAMSDRQRGDLHLEAAEAHQFAAKVNDKAAKTANASSLDPTDHPKYFQSQAAYHTREARRHKDIARARFKST